ncbi:MAG: DUF3552 domain-containing protein, partial [Nitrospirae bacterium]|nr:DUF3552 domain-containing protein [Nitrospirota bacterium]
MLLKKVESEIRFEEAKLIKQIEQEAKDESEKRARHIIGLCLITYVFGLNKGLFFDPLGLSFSLSQDVFVLMLKRFK